MTADRLADEPRSDVAAVPLRVLQDRKLRKFDFNVLCIIAHRDRSNWGGQACWESAEQIAAIIGHSVRRVNNSIERLIAASYVREPDLEPGEQRSASRRPLCIVFTAEDIQLAERLAEDAR